MTVQVVPVEKKDKRTEDILNAARIAQSLYGAYKDYKEANPDQKTDMNQSQTSPLKRRMEKNKAYA